MEELFREHSKEVLRTKKKKAQKQTEKSTKQKKAEAKRNKGSEKRKPKKLNGKPKTECRNNKKGKQMCWLPKKLVRSKRKRR